jgi:Holliday junction resolvase
MNTKRKGARCEHRCMRLLEEAGYRCTRAAASLGVFDVIAVGPVNFRLIQVKGGSARCSSVEREQIALFPVPANASKEVWRFPDHCRKPLIEYL